MLFTDVSKLGIRAHSPVRETDMDSIKLPCTVKYQRDEETLGKNLEELPAWDVFSKQLEGIFEFGEMNIGGTHKATEQRMIQNYLKNSIFRRQKYR